MGLFDFQVGFTTFSKIGMTYSPVEVCCLNICQTVRLATCDKHHICRNEGIRCESYNVPNSDSPPWSLLELLVH